MGNYPQRQSFASDVIVDASVFCNSTRSVINAGSLRGILEKKGVRAYRCVFVGASRATATEVRSLHLALVPIRPRPRGERRF